MFAYDSKLFRTITSEEDIQLLQQDLETLEQWSATWLLHFHPGKCKIITVGSAERPRAFKYCLLNIELEHIGEEKDLGVYVDENLSFECHQASLQDARPTIFLMPHFRYSAATLYELCTPPCGIRRCRLECKPQKITDCRYRENTNAGYRDD